MRAVDKQTPTYSTAPQVGLYSIEITSYLAMTLFFTLPQHLSRYDNLLYLRCTFVNLSNFGVAH